ncbi:unnamed protein product [Thelazia callipaeda]|uniref:KCNQ_channel domain-containing protein n=1 Tax=Thelazia callipaeda TaxID=103827 RepID=A0A0N5D5D6_THECL|nr:unnamed protein product [Thelazia callipaeda]
MSSSSVPNNPFFLGTQIQSSSTGSDSRRISSSLVDETRKLDEYKPPEAKRLRSNFSSPQKAGILKAATRASIPNMDEAPANECDAKKFSGTLMESEEPVHDARIYRRSSILTRNVAQTNTKKLVIHGFKQNVPGNAEESDPFETKWHPLEVAVLAIQKKMKAEISLEQLYEICCADLSCFMLVKFIAVIK